MQNPMMETVYEFIKQYMEKEGMPPSQREIAAGCYIAKSDVIRHLDRLEAWGGLRGSRGRRGGFGW